MESFLGSESARGGQLCEGVLAEAVRQSFVQGRATAAIVQTPRIIVFLQKFAAL